MRLLLDTHAFLWFVVGDARLSRRALHTIENDEAELFLSVASVWEMAIKSSMRRLTLPLPVTAYIAEKIENGFRVLPIEWEYAAAVENLPFHHRDPFDRLIIAQALAENMPIVTADPVFRAYHTKVIW